MFKYGFHITGTFEVEPGSVPDQRLKEHLLDQATVTPNELIELARQQPGGLTIEVYVVVPLNAEVCDSCGAAYHGNAMCPICHNHWPWHARSGCPICQLWDLEHSAVEREGDV